MLDLMTVEFAQVAQAMGQNLNRDGGLNVGRLRLNGLVADRGKITCLISHAALLPAHAEPTRLTGVVSGQGLGSIF